MEEYAGVTQFDKGQRCEFMTDCAAPPRIGNQSLQIHAGLNIVDVNRFTLVGREMIDTRIAGYFIAGNSDFSHSQ